MSETARIGGNGIASKRQNAQQKNEKPNRKDIERECRSVMDDEKSRSGRLWLKWILKQGRDVWSRKV